MRQIGQVPQFMTREMADSIIANSTTACFGAGAHSGEGVTVEGAVHFLGVMKSRWGY